MIAPITNGVPIGLAQETPPIEMASLKRRWVAYGIDSSILALADSLIRLVLGSIPSAFLSPSSLFNSAVDLTVILQVASAAIRVTVPALYYVWAYSSGGQTIGKTILGIKVVSIDGSPLTWRTGILRTVGYIPSTIAFSLGFLAAAFDKDKQAWHDKIAGTCVVRASVPSEAFLGRVGPTEVRSKQRRWLIVSGVVTAIALVAFWLLIRAGVSEVAEMGPWPGRDENPEQVATIDLSPLGLMPTQVKDARSSNDWAKGNYNTGAVVYYTAGRQEIVSITALQYFDTGTASREFGGLVEWAKENCQWHAQTTSFNMGIIRCGARGGHDRIMWNAYWMLDIVALDHGELPAEQLVDRVRDALSEKWKHAR